jgi:hypothetical protein
MMMGLNNRPQGESEKCRVFICGEGKESFAWQRIRRAPDSLLQKKIYENLGKVFIHFDD